MTNAIPNRVVQELEAWQVRERNVAALFSPATVQSSYFQRLKWDYYRQLDRSLRARATPEERLTLRILRGEARELERRIYPNRWIRLGLRTLRAAYRIIRGTDRSPEESTDWMLAIEPGKAVITRTGNEKRRNITELKKNQGPTHRPSKRI